MNIFLIIIQIIIKNVAPFKTLHTIKIMAIISSNE